MLIVACLSASSLPPPPPKVLVLDSVCVDCSQRMISWNVVNSADVNSNISAVIAQQLRSKITFNGSARFGESTTSTRDCNLPLDRSACSLESPDHCHPQATLHSSPLHSSPLHHSTPPRGGGSPQSVSSLGVLFPSPLGGGSPGGEGGRHSFMAPHDGDLSLCTDDLQSLFELAQELFGVHSTSLIQSSEQDLVREGKRGRRKEGESDGGKGGWEEWREREGGRRKEGGREW